MEQLLAIAFAAYFITYVIRKYLLGSFAVDSWLLPVLATTIAVSTSLGLVGGSWQHALVRGVGAAGLASLLGVLHSLVEYASDEKQLEVFRQ
jgi:tellurite resistance protein TehA-like permease